MVVPVGVLFGDRSLMRKFHIIFPNYDFNNYGPTDTCHTSVVTSECAINLRYAM